MAPLEPCPERRLPLKNSVDLGLVVAMTYCMHDEDAFEPRYDAHAHAHAYLSDASRAGTNIFSVDQGEELYLYSGPAAGLLVEYRRGRAGASC